MEWCGMAREVHTNTLLREIECGGGDGVAQAVTSLAVALVVSVEM
jgi:hypothetical protein